MTVNHLYGFNILLILLTAVL